MCSWNLFFESKIFSQCLQTIFLQTISWICYNNRVNDEKNAKQFKHEWYCDERKANETKEKFWIENFAENFAENAMIKIFSHSFRLFLTISFSFCFLYQINAKLRRQSNNRINKSDFRYWCWHCRNCCKKFAISLNRLNFWISQTSVASKKSIFAATKIDFVISSCKTNEHSNDFWKCFFNDSKFRLFAIFSEQCIHFALYSSSMHLNSATMMSFLVKSLFFQIQYWKFGNFSSYVFRNLTNKAKAKENSIFDFSAVFSLTIFFDWTFCWSCMTNEQCDVSWKCFFNDSNVKYSSYINNEQMIYCMTLKFELSSFEKSTTIMIALKWRNVFRKFRQNFRIANRSSCVNNDFNEEKIEVL